MGATVPADKDLNAFDDDEDFEDVSPPGDDPADGSAEEGDGKPRGFASGPPWARKALIGGVVVLVLYLMFVWLPHRSHHDSSAPSTPKATTTTVATTDPLADRPKVNPIVSAVVGKDVATRNAIKVVVDRALKQGADQCSLYWGMTGSGWSIEYQRPGGPALPNYTWSVPLFVDTHCFPTVTSPLINFAAIAPIVTTTQGGAGSALSNGSHQPLTPTGDQ